MYGNMVSLGDATVSLRESLGIAGLIVGLSVLGFALEGNGYFLRIATLILMYAGMAGAWNKIGRAHV